MSLEQKGFTKTNPSIALLRRHEPILRFTKGERFFPMDVARYVLHCSLWAQRPDRKPIRLVPYGKLSLDTLGKPHPDEFGTVHYLKLVDPLSPANLAAYTMQSNIEERSGFKAGRARLARVGYLSRMVDALFSLSLLARGRVPGDTAAAAELVYRKQLHEHKRFTYHGRVVEQEGWTVLQYWYFYLFNNWRSGFSGANDHEADWEMVSLYLARDEAGELRPEWVAYASHDYHGDDLRRHWSDPELVRDGAHPVIFVGAGSHASYFGAGEYLAELELAFLRPLIRVTDQLQRLWYDRLRQYRFDSPDEADEHQRLFRIPFVDYARGDGRTIGPGQEHIWFEPRLIDEGTPWVAKYRGLWGLYTRDPFAGEDAPAGPMYNRDGTVRRSWYDPVGWAGLDKVPPPVVKRRLISERLGEIDGEQAARRSEIEEKTQRLRELGVEAMAMRQQPHLNRLYDEHERKLAALSEEINQLRSTVSQESALRAALARYEQQLRDGGPFDYRSHIRHVHEPTAAATLRITRVAELWAALSSGLMLILLVLLLLFAPAHLVIGSIALILLFFTIEATFRGQIIRFVTRLTVLLAVVASLVLLRTFFWQIVVALLLLIGLYIIADNVRELLVTE